MFRFEMDGKDADSVSQERLSRASIERDWDFDEELNRRFTETYGEDFDPGDFNTEAAREYDFSQSLQAFRIDDQSPTNQDEAIQIIHEVFFFPPRRLWLYDEAGNEREIRAFDVDEPTRIGSTLYIPMEEGEEDEDEDYLTEGERSEMPMSEGQSLKSNSSLSAAARKKRAVKRALQKASRRRNRR